MARWQLPCEGAHEKAAWQVESPVMNRVKLQGRVDTSINVKQTKTGKSVVNFRIAVKERGQTYEEKFTIVAWEADADFVGSSVKEGDIVTVLGRMANRSWENPRSGNREYRVEIIAKSGGITLDREGEAPAKAETPAPAAPAPSQPSPAPEAAADDDDDDMVF